MSQVINGLNATLFQTSANYSLALTNAIASCMVGVSASDATEESGATTEETPPAEGEEAGPPSPQVVTVQLFAPSAAENVSTDVDAARSELAALWATSGGAAEAVAIS